MANKGSLTVWKKGRGKLGIFKPVLGTWVTEANSPMGRVVCHRRYETVLKDKYVQLWADWTIGSGASHRTYNEIALFGTNAEGILSFWSFTSDGKQSTGWISTAVDVHEKAICFEADMPAGRARQVYWPHPDTGFYWTGDAQTKKGWNTMAKHHYVEA